MTNVLDFFVYLYNLQWHKSRLLTPSRFITRKLASYFIPRWLKHDSSDCRINAQSYLRPRGINKKVIVSLTSFPARISEVWQVIECVKRQTILPDRIVLWLSKEQFESGLPESLIRRCDELFEVRFVEGDIRSHKKYYYAFKEFRDDIVILIDDDLYYPTFFVEQLLNEFLKHPNSIIMRYGDVLKYDKQSILLKYNDWFQELPGPSTSKYLFFGSGGGTLFSPSILNEHICDIKDAIKVTPLADDIWLNAFVNLSAISKVKVDYAYPLSISIRGNRNLYSENVYNNQNDIQFKNIINYCVKRFGVNPFAKEYIENNIKL